MAVDTEIGNVILCCFLISASSFYVVAQPASRKSSPSFLYEETGVVPPSKRSIHQDRRDVLCDDGINAHVKEQYIYEETRVVPLLAFSSVVSSDVVPLSPGVLFPSQVVFSISSTTFYKIVLAKQQIT